MRSTMKILLCLLVLGFAWPLSAAAECSEGDLTCCTTDSPGTGKCNIAAKPGTFPRLLTSADCGTISGVSYPGGLQLDPDSECAACNQGGTTQCVVWEWDTNCSSNPDHFTFMVPNAIPVIGAAPGPSTIYAAGAGDNKGVGAYMSASYAVRVASANDNDSPLLVTPAATTEPISVVGSFGRKKEACELGFATELVNTFIPVNPVTVYNFKGCEVSFSNGGGGQITGGECAFLDANGNESQNSNGVPFSDLEVKFGDVPLGIVQAVGKNAFLGTGVGSCVTFEFGGRIYAITVDDGQPGC